MPHNAALPIVLLAIVAAYATILPQRPPLSYVLLGLIGLFGLWSVWAAGRESRRSREAHAENVRLQRHLIEGQRLLLHTKPGDKFVEVGVARVELPLGSRWERFKRKMRSLLRNLSG